MSKHLINIILSYSAFIKVSSSSSCGTCRSLHLPEFDGKKVSDFPLSTYQDLQHVWQCSSRCWDDLTCISYMFNSGTGMCSTFAAGYSDVANTYNPISQEVGAKLYTAACGRSGHGEGCTQDGQCVASNTECIYGTCKCTPGYSHKPNANACVPMKDCTNYGPSMTEYPGMAIVGHNTRTLTSVTSMEDCINACVSETTFVCLSADYNTGTNDCSLQNVGYLDVDSSTRVANNAVYNHASRDCSDTQ